MTTFHSEPAATRPKMRLGWRPVAGGIALLLLIGFAALLLRARSFDGGPLPPAITSARTIPITLPDGRRTQLGSLLRPGLPTIVNLWATWCGPCRTEMPHLAELRGRFGPDALNVILLNVRDTTSSSQDKADFLATFGLAAKDSAILDESRIGGLTNKSDVLIPRTIIFDRSGAPVGVITGYKPLALDRIAGLVAS